MLLVVLKGRTMHQARLLIATLKQELKKQNKTYKHVAKALELSEASVKRLFCEEAFSLERLDKICELLQMEFTDLVKLMEKNINLTSQLTLTQEQELVADIRLLLMAHFLIHGLLFSEIITRYKISETEGIQLLAKLDRMKVIELLPGNKVKMIISKDFQWIKNGPIQYFYQRNIQPEFLESSFTAPEELRIFVSGLFSSRSTNVLIKKIQRLANEFNELNFEDQSVDSSQRVGTSLVVAMRSWEPSVFSQLRRIE